jgi:nucleoside-diphosphate-sugar epimerase
MKVLVAGGAGFIGSHVCERLLSDGHEVVCLDNLITGSRSNIAHLEGSTNFRLIVADVVDAPDMDVDRVLHLASPASPVDYDRLQLETMRANALGTWRLLDVAQRAGATLTFASTSEVYGDPLVHPQPESYWGNVDPIGPRSCYDESKRFGEALIMASRRTKGLRANIARLFNTYGPRMRLDDGRVIPELLAAALEGRPLLVHGDGSQTRSFCFVSDLVEGLLTVALDPDIDGEVFNIGNPAEVTIRELAEQISDMADGVATLRFVERRPGDPERRRPDISRMRARYGWQPTVPLSIGLQRTAETLAKRSMVDARPLANMRLTPRSGGTS